MFRLPIEGLSEVKRTQASMVVDLELVQSAEGKPMGEVLYGPTSERGRLIAARLAQVYTTSVPFLRDTVKWIAKSHHLKGFDAEPFADAWKKHHDTIEFNNLYHYVEHEKLEALNRIPIVLLFLSIYSITSPVMFLLSPLLILLMPFVMLNMTGRNVDWASYKTTLYDVLKRHALGGLLVGLKEANANQIVTGLLTAGLFAVQVYTNVQSCIQFYKSIDTVHSVLEKTRDYVEHVTQMMDVVETHAPATYGPFVDDVKKHHAVLTDMLTKLKQIKPMSNSYQEVKQIGRLRYLFYDLKHNASWRASIEYSLQFSGYVETMLHLNHLLKTKQINPCLFGKKADKMVGGYYPPQPKNERHTYHIKNVMITGPNASGKTTFIKSAMLNVLFSQQIGCGFYKKLYLKTPYEKLFCYLNIPDTSGRDSLFQAEARRCREVLTEVEDGARILCIFDELFSGTNPSEASASAYAFLKHLAGLPNVTFLLTTHFLDVCTKLDAQVQNAHMTTRNEGGDLTYEYKFKMGISRIKGGLKVLKDLNYPSSILDCAQNFN
jgi:hypothetical protein